MNKRIEIKLIDPECNYTRLYANNDVLVEEIRPQLFTHECYNILKEAKKANVSTDELLNAIVAEMYERNVYRMVIDIDEREKCYAPAKEMTLSEIEAALGHKVKIVEDENDQITETPEVTKSCVRCKHKLNLTHDVSSPCYTCCRNPDDYRLPDKFVEDDE